jgi:hypothetical protein
VHQACTKADQNLLSEALRVETDNQVNSIYPTHFVFLQKGEIIHSNKSVVNNFKNFLDFNPAGTGSKISRPKGALAGKIIQN